METRTVSIGPLEYRITEEGNIFKRRGSGFLKPFPDKDGYLKVVVISGGKTYNASVHRLVYQAFHGRDHNGLTVDHIDGDKTNNHYSNLQLLTAEDNAVKGNALHWVFLSPSQEVVEIYNLAKFCRDNGLHKGHMAGLKRRPHKHHKGWRYYV